MLPSKAANKIRPHAQNIGTSSQSQQQSKSCPQIINSHDDNDNDVENDKKTTRGQLNENIEESAIKKATPLQPQPPPPPPLSPQKNITNSANLASGGCAACDTTTSEKSIRRDTKSAGCVHADNNNTLVASSPPHTTAPFHTLSSIPTSFSTVGASSWGSENFESSRSQQSHVIPGVEHVFFEEELEKMEQQASNDKNKNIIVLAADGSTHSELAFKFYKENVDRPGYYLHVVHHSDVWSHYTPGPDGPSVDHCKEMAEKAKGLLDGVEEKYKKLMEENNIKGETVVLHGKDAWHDIIQHQEATNAMMIVMGTRGHGAISRTFRGSVSDSVVHHANVPVLVCCHPKEHH